MRTRQRAKLWKWESNWSKINTQPFITTLPHTSAYSLSTFTASCLSFISARSSGVWREANKDSKSFFICQKWQIKNLNFSSTTPCSKKKSSICETSFTVKIVIIKYVQILINKACAHTQLFSTHMLISNRNLEIQVKIGRKR